MTLARAGVAGLGMGGVYVSSMPFVSPLFYLIMLGGTYSTVTRLLGHFGMFGYQVSATASSSSSCW